MNVPVEHSDIVRRLGAAAAERARLKREGGDKAIQGYEFETVVALVTLLREAGDWFELDCPANGPTFVYQPLGFVDDLSILRHDGSEFIQIKDVERQIWGRSERSLASDFRKQKTLLEGLPGHVRLVLVVSREEVAVSLERSKPSGLEAVEIERVAPANLPNAACFDPSLSRSIRYFLEPPGKRADLATACSAFVSAWSAFKGAGTVQDLYEEARYQSNGVLRSLGTTIEIGNAAQSAIEDIQDGRVEPRGRRLFYWDEDGLRGKQAFYEDDEYGAFERLLIAKGPSTIDEFVALLGEHRDRWS